MVFSILFLSTLVVGPRLTASLCIKPYSLSRFLDQSSHVQLITRVNLVDKDDEFIGYKEISNQPKFDVSDTDQLKKRAQEAAKLNARYEANSKKSATFGSMTVEDLKRRMIKLENSEGKPLPKRTEDLNGINPLIPLVSSIVPFGMTYLGFQLSAYLTANFAIQFLTSDIYTLRRVAIVARNVLVGMTTLATTFSGVIGVGLFTLGVAVAVGVLKGDLDPNKKDITASDGDNSR